MVTDEETGQVVVNDAVASVTAIRLFDLLPEHRIVTLSNAAELLKASKPTASKAIDALTSAGVLGEITGRRRDRVFAYRAYLDVLAEDTEVERPQGG
ncbi:MAG: helix-turn-helix transcriptional regulator [Candidatus Brocadiae bacterium]|nr:helix-turn-helix transcriptional regulator [Candidatus Brocadiia bacterium]